MIPAILRWNFKILNKSFYSKRLMTADSKYQGPNISTPAQTIFLRMSQVYLQDMETNTTPKKLMGFLEKFR